jgi:hypothetical protein
MANKKIAEPFGLVTQREWTGLIARGADLDHVGMFMLLRVRADRDGVTRDTLTTLGKWMNRSDDRASTLLAWLRDAGVISSDRKPRRQGSQGSAWVVERRALALEEWKSTASTRASSKEKSTADTRASSPKSTADSDEEHRISDRRAPHSLPCNPRRIPEKPQPENAGKAFPPGVREVGAGRLASQVFAILAASQHRDAFAGKLNDLADLALRYPDRDIEQACDDFIEEVEVIKYDSKAISLLESFVLKAPRVAAPEPEFHCNSCGMTWMPSDRCRKAGFDSKPGDECGTKRPESPYCGHGNPKLECPMLICSSRPLLVASPPTIG